MWHQIVRNAMQVEDLKAHQLIVTHAIVVLIMVRAIRIMLLLVFHEIVQAAIPQTQVGDLQHLIIIIITQFQGLIQGLVVRNAMWVVDITIHQVLV